MSAAVRVLGASQVAARQQHQQKLDVLLAMPLLSWPTAEPATASSNSSSSSGSSSSSSSNGGKKDKAGKGTTASSGSGASIAETKRKMELLGMLSGQQQQQQQQGRKGTTAATASSSSSSRVAAETRWMDGLPGEGAGCCWPGPVRRGASADAVSRAVRRLHAARIFEHAAAAEKKQKQKQKQKDNALSFEEANLWRPPRERSGGLVDVIAAAPPPPASSSNLNNGGATEGWWPSPAGEAEDSDESDDNDESDDQQQGSFDPVTGEQQQRSPPPRRRPFRTSRRWGGRWGKACGHNEVVMHVLRPFAPLEVLNTRLCSAADPAPGNGGYHGCLEFLRLQSRRRGRAMTCWDSAALHWIGPDGGYDLGGGGSSENSVPKRELLAWPLPRLEATLAALRTLTVDCGGSVPPRALLRLVGAFLVAGATRAALGILRQRQRQRQRESEGDGSDRSEGRASDENAALILPRPATRRVVAFVIGGDVGTWRACLSRTPAHEWIWHW